MDGDFKELGVEGRIVTVLCREGFVGVFGTMELRFCGRFMIGSRDFFGESDLLTSSVIVSLTSVISTISK